MGWVFRQFPHNRSVSVNRSEKLGPLSRPGNLVYQWYTTFLDGIPWYTSGIPSGNYTFSGIPVVYHSGIPTMVYHRGNGLGYYNLPLEKNTHSTLHTHTHTHTLLHTSTHYYTLLHTSTHYYTLLHTSTHHYTLLHTTTHYTHYYTLLHTT